VTARAGRLLPGWASTGYPAGVTEPQPTTPPAAPPTATAESQPAAVIAAGPTATRPVAADRHSPSRIPAGAVQDVPARVAKKRMVITRPAGPGDGRQGLSTRTAVIFALVGLVLAGAMVALYLTKGTAVVQPAARSTPESAVREFLSAVFVADDKARLAAVVCSSWNAADAMSRTNAMMDPTARVSWDDLNVVTNQNDRVTMTARLGLRLPADSHPSAYEQWHFTVVNESGWRVCDAARVVT
jgi:hypothetical protein